MLTTILFPLLVVSAPDPTPKVGLPLAEPPVKVWLNDDQFVRGDRARVYVKTDRDGYVLVLHTEPDGRIRVLFPMDPSDDNYVQAGETYEVRSRGDRDAFTAYDTEGTGMVYAAYSPDPFRFDGFVREGHWDYRLDAFRAGDDPEADLTDLARQMAAGSAFEYDLVSYDVTARVAYRTYSPRYYGGWYDSWYDPWYSPWRTGFHIGISWGRPWYYSSWNYDPWYYDPWYNPYYYGYYRPYYHRPYSYGSWWDPWGYRGYRTTVIYQNYYNGYPSGWSSWRTGTVTPRRYAFNYAQPGRRSLALYDPERNVIAAGRRSILPPTDIVAPNVAVPRMRDTGPLTPAAGRRADPQVQSPARGQDQPRRVEPTTPDRRATPQGQEPRRGVSDQPRRVEPTTPARGTNEPVRRAGPTTPVREPVRGANEQARRAEPTTPTRAPRGLVPVREGDSRAVAPRRDQQSQSLSRPSQPRAQQPESNARPQLERRTAPERSNAPQARPSQPSPSRGGSQPRASSPPPRSSSPPRASSPAPRSGGSSAPRAAPRPPSSGGRSQPSAPSSGRRKG